MSDEIYDELAEPFFAKAYNIIMADRKISPTVANVYFYLKSRCFGRRISVFPSQEQISDDIGFGERCVRDSLKNLQKYGLIEIKANRDGYKRLNNKYILKDLRVVYGDRAFLGWDNLNIEYPQACRETVKKIIIIEDKLADDDAARELKPKDRINLKGQALKNFEALLKRRLSGKERSVLLKSLSELKEREQKEIDLVMNRSLARQRKRLEANIRKYSGYSNTGTKDPVADPTGTGDPVRTGTGDPVRTGTGDPINKKNIGEEDKYILEQPEKQAAHICSDSLEGKEDTSIESTGIEAKDKELKEPDPVEAKKKVLSAHEARMAFAGVSKKSDTPERAVTSLSKSAEQNRQDKLKDKTARSFSAIAAKSKAPNNLPPDCPDIQTWEEMQVSKVFPAYFVACMAEKGIDASAGSTGRSKKQWKNTFWKRVKTLDRGFQVIRYTVNRFESLKRKYPTLNPNLTESLFFSAWIDTIMQDALKSGSVKTKKSANADILKNTKLAEYYNAKR